MCSLEEAFPITDGGEIKKKKLKKRPLLPPPETGPDLTYSPPSDPDHWTPPSEQPASWTDFAAAPDPYYFHPDSYILKAPEWADHDWIRKNLPEKNTELAPTPQPWFDSAPTLWQNIPTDWKGGETRDAGSMQQFNRLDELQSRIDSLFARLQETDRVRSESNHTEVILFILGGLFLLLILDLLVKQGTQASIWMAAANSTPSSFVGAFKGGRRLYK
jgi:hypothetical protein